jgi:uncharacterized membrane protein
VTTTRDVVLLASLAASSALTIVLGLTDPVGIPVIANRFLAWNLFLAWIPLVAACGIVEVERKFVPLLGVVWLAFLPNALYLVTDLVHLSDGVVLWRQVLQFGFAAWTGTLLAVVSLRMVHRRVESEFGTAKGWTVVMAAVLLSGAGVAIGRFQRWNSWDLLSQPGSVVRGSLDWVRSPLADIQITGVAIAVTAFFGIAYLTVWSLSAQPTREPA